MLQVKQSILFTLDGAKKLGEMLPLVALFFVSLSNFLEEIVASQK